MNDGRSNCRRRASKHISQRKGLGSLLADTFSKEGISRHEDPGHSKSHYSQIMAISLVFLFHTRQATSRWTYLRMLKIALPPGELPYPQTSRTWQNQRHRVICLQFGPEV